LQKVQVILGVKYTSILILIVAAMERHEHVFAKGKETWSRREAEVPVTVVASPSVIPRRSS
jgi:hypothetical protein